MSVAVPYLLMIGCFDTKGEVYSYLRDCLVEQGERVFTVNTGIMEASGQFPIDIEADIVAREGGESLAALREKGDRGYAVEIMSRGAAKIVSTLVSVGGLAGAVAMGGGGGTFIALSAMSKIPIGVPKVCLSTLATKDLSRQIGSKDIMLIPSVVDVAGLNSISKILIKQAAVAVSAISKAPMPATADYAGRIAISMFGNTTACVDQCTYLLQRQGYEVFAFHANGQGGRTMEALIREKFFDGILDITTTELADDLCGGICSAGPDRLSAALEVAVPQVIVPGCMDMVNFGPMDTVPPQYNARQLYSWAPDVTLMRTDKDENVQLGERLAEKVNKSTAPVKVLFPLKGLSQLDAEGQLFFKPEANRALLKTLAANLKEPNQLLEVDLHINDRKFAEMAVNSMVELLAENRRMSR